MAGRSCFFLGHREADEALYPALLAQVRRHAVDCGVTEFVVGRNGGFDRLAARAVAQVKRERDGLTALLLTAYHPAERPVTLPEGFDAVYWPPELAAVPRRYAIARADRLVLGQVDHLIAWVTHPGSSAAGLLAYARRREAKGLLRVTILGGDGPDGRSSFP